MDLTKLRCPYCGKIRDGVTAVTAGANETPKKGDITMCLDCANVSVFGDDCLCKPTPQDEATWTPDMKRELGIAKQLIIAYNERKNNKQQTDKW